jgi:hypothetical protein
MTSVINPTIYLKSINLKKTISLYQQSKFPDNKKEKITKKNNKSIISRKLGDDTSFGIFMIKNKNGNEVVIATSSHKFFEEFNNKQEIKKGGRCETCLLDFETERIGYPVKYEEEKFLIQGEIPHYRIYYFFWIEGCFCSYECCLYFIRNVLSKPCDSRDTILRESERMLKLLFKLLFGENKILEPCKDPRLLDSNGGCLPLNEWRNKIYVYLRSDRIIIIPAKVEYLQFKIN